MDLSALQRCVGDVDGFLERHWNRAPLLHEYPDGFDDLASLDDFDRMIASLGLRASSLRMVRDGMSLTPTAYTVAPGKQPRASERLVSPALVYRRFSEGATIVLESLHRFWEPLTDFCRDLELALGHRLQVNAYITPPSSQGFDIHKDTHDVFVLQVSGSKNWTVYDRDDEDEVVIRREISPGSVLYIPTGFPHDATTGSGASAHLTVGILPRDATEIVGEIAKLAEEEPIFKERLEVGAAVDPSALRAVVERNLDEMRAWLDKVDVDELTARVARKVMSTSQPILRGQLRQLAGLDSIEASTEVRRRRGATCALLPGEAGLRVMLADRELQMPLTARDAMTYVATHERFPVSDLHPFLTLESAVVLVKRLVREGLLEVL
ncbi:MAG TPA: cupin domain-containing protein [Actinomycetota bacterium]|nr:cupin domain-containing protein [Actinomycetota bacterium]